MVWSSDLPRAVYRLSNASKLHNAHSTSSACSTVTSSRSTESSAEPLSQVGHTLRSAFLHPLDGSAERGGVEVVHREQHPIDHDVFGVHPVSRGYALAQVSACIRICHRFSEAGQAGAVRKVLGEGIEQSSARAEDRGGRR